MNTVEVKIITKIFDGNVNVVDCISFNVKKGEIIGFLDPLGWLISLELWLSSMF